MTARRRTFEAGTRPLEGGTRPLEAGATFVLALALAALCGCGALTGGNVECTADDQCPLDARCRAGSCVAITGEGEGEGEGASGEGEGEGVAGEGEGEGGEGEGEGAAHCTLDDGDLTASDIPVVPGLPLRMIESDSSSTSSPDVPVNVDGTTANNATTWDFTTALGTDAPFQIEAALLGDQWYASTFSDEQPLGQDGVGAYVAPLSSDTVAIFRRNTEKLVILGVASVEANFTLITYDPPILVLQFPLTEGATFQSDSTGTGTFETNPFYVSDDVYESSIDASGTVVTNAGTFKALRLHVAQSVTVGIFNVTHIQYAWIAPCLGVIAQTTSGDDETDDHYTVASQLRRLAAP